MMTEAELRAAVRDAMHTLDATVEANIRRELSEPIDLGHSRRLQFEACPHFFGIHLVQTSEEVLPDSAIDDVIPAHVRVDAEAADLEIFEVIHSELPKWFADR